MIVSDHSPAPAEVKRLDDGDFGEAWGGIGSYSCACPQHGRGRWSVRSTCPS